MTRPQKDYSVHWLTPHASLGRIIGVCALLLFAFMAWLVFIDRYTYFDEFVFGALTPHRNDNFTRIMRFISFLGNTSYLSVANILLVVFFLVRKEKWTALRVAAVAISSVALMSLLKRTFHRVRPDEPLIQGITNFSFPSGHAFMSVAFYGLLICWALSEIRNRSVRTTVVIALLILIFLIGFSRVYLRVHYSTDILAGWGMATAWLIISLTIMDRIENRYHK